MVLSAVRRAEQNKTWDQHFTFWGSVSKLLGLMRNSLALPALRPLGPSSGCGIKALYTHSKQAAYTEQAGQAHGGEDICLESHRHSITAKGIPTELFQQSPFQALKEKYGVTAA